MEGLEGQVAELSQRVVDLEMELTSRGSLSSQGDTGTRGHPGSSAPSWKGTQNDGQNEACANPCKLATLS